MEKLTRQEKDEMFALNPKDDKLFADTYNHYIPLLTRLYRFKYKTIDPEISKDIVIESFFKAVRKIHQYNPLIAKFNTWLYTIVQREFIRYINNHFGSVYSLDLINNDGISLEAEETFSPDSMDSPDQSLFLNEIKDYVLTLPTKNKHLWIEYLENGLSLDYMYKAHPEYSKSGIRSVLFRITEKVSNKSTFKSKFAELYFN